MKISKGDWQTLVHSTLLQEDQLTALSAMIPLKKCLSTLTHQKKSTFPLVLFNQSILEARDMKISKGDWQILVHSTLLQEDQLNITIAKIL